MDVYKNILVNVKNVKTIETGKIILTDDEITDDIALAFCVPVFVWIFVFHVCLIRCIQNAYNIDV